MEINRKGIVFFIGIILIISSIFIINSLGTVDNKKPLNKDGDKDTPDPDNQNFSEGNPGKNGKKDNQNISRYVFVEEGSFTSCKFCVPVAEILHELYKSQEIPFYYISLVRENINAEKILTNDYNIFAYPTVFIDGGYQVVYGAKDRSVYKNKIQEAYNREKPNVFVNISGEWDEDNKEILLSGYIKNMENKDYKGIFKIYIAEKISTQYRDNDGNPFHFAFIDFALNREVTIQKNSTYNFSIKLEEKNLDPENLMLFAVLSNSSYKTTYSDPEGQGGKNERKFSAYFVDSIDATEVVEGGNTPPAVGIKYPKQGRIHFLGKERLNFQFRNTFLFGKTTIKVDAQDDGSISKVEFFIDSQKVETDENAPYEYTIRKVGLFRNLVRRHTIKVVAYDNENKKSEDVMDVIAFFL